MEVGGGAATVEADLQGVELLAFRIGGGAAGLVLMLPPPVGTVPVSIGGGASTLRVVRPREVPVRVIVRGGASKLAFDDEAFGAVGGRVRLQSDGFNDETDRYDITIGGGASKLTIAAT